MITIYNKKYCKKLIFLIEKQNHPEQFHKVKKETFNIIYGKIFIKINGKRKILDQGEIITILPGQRHEFGSVLKKGAIIEELSSESVKSDSYYTDKKIIKNKKRKSYISLNYNFFS
jgi:quercetin dioxygenase-like cupin family protein